MGEVLRLMKNTKEFCLSVLRITLNVKDSGW